MSKFAIFSHRHPWTPYQIAQRSPQVLRAVYYEIMDGLQWGTIYRPGAFSQTAINIQLYLHSIGESLTQPILRSSSTARFQGAASDIIVQSPPQRVIQVQAPAPAPQIVQAPQSPQIIHVPAPRPQVIIETRDQFGRLISRVPAPQTADPDLAVSSLLAIESGSASDAGGAEVESDDGYEEWKRRNHLE
ncbi:Nn.00g080580.m01.CDS01 [Neocucurbitaria sp. VM-36]